MPQEILSDLLRVYLKIILTLGVKSFDMEFKVGIHR